MIEEWKTIPEFNCYEVSNTGRLRNRLSLKEIKPIPNRSGYVQYGFRSVPGEKPHTKCLHRFFAIAFIPNPDNLPEVNHKDGVKSNNHIDNLEWVSKSRNKKHAFEIGLCEKARATSRNNINKINKGQCNHNSKWSDVERLAVIQELRDNTGTLISIARKYGMSKSTISKVNNKQIWKHLI
jgi:hypothetical protein